MYASINPFAYLKSQYYFAFVLVSSVFTFLLSFFGYTVNMDTLLLIFNVFYLKMNNLLHCIESVNHIYLQI